MKIAEIVTESASGGATGAGSIASMPMGGGGSKVGTLFGGTYKQPSTKKKSKKPTESIIKR